MTQHFGIDCYLCWSAIDVWAQRHAVVIANLGFLSMNVRGYIK